MASSSAQHPAHSQRIEMLPADNKARQVPMHTPLLEASTSAGSTDVEPATQSRQRVKFQPTDVFLRFANDILARGLSKTLDDSDVDDPLEADDPHYTCRVIGAAWDHRKHLGSPSLLWCFYKCWRRLFLLAGVLHIFDVGLQFVAPQMIKVLINYVDAEQKSIAAGLVYALIFFLAPALQAIAGCHFNLHMRSMGFRMRGATAALVYRKILRLSQKAESAYGPGKLTNIMSTDTFRLDIVPFHSNFLWSMPLMLIVGTWLMYQDFGVAAFVPILITCLQYPMNRRLTSRLMANSREISMTRDSRIKLLTEVLHALELIKQLTWERHIKGLVDEKRTLEMNKIAYQKLLDVLNTVVWLGTPALLPMATVGSYVLMGGQLEPGKVFTLFALLDLIAFPMKIIPEALQFLVTAKVGIDRIQQLLLADEMVELPYPVSVTDNSVTAPVYVRSTKFDEQAIPELGMSQPRTYATPVRLSDVDLRWAKAPPDTNQQEVAQLSAVNEPATLSVHSLEILQGKLVLIVGPVGAGKSTLLHGLLNEVPILRGCVEVCGSVAYCSQKPWVMNATVRDNILFGSEYDPDLFKDVVHACSLEADIKQLQDGENTLIGARGVNLSGGQKARVSLARAVYAKRSIYILDDPLAAVDPHVATHLVEECLCGFLQGTTRILVTHQLQFLQKADLVVVIQHGQTVAARHPSEFSSAELEQFGVDASKQADQHSSGADSTATASDAPASPTADARLGPPVLLLRAKSAPARVLASSDSSESSMDMDIDFLPPPRLQLQRAITAPLRYQGCQSPSMDEGSNGIAMELSMILESPSETPPERGQARQQEERQTGQVSAKFWLTYARAMGWSSALALVSLYLMSNGLQLLALFWVAQWTEESGNSTLMPLVIYALLSLGTIALVAVRTLIFRQTSLRVSTSMHDKALWAVMRSCKSWLDTTPTGRIVNRFSQDMQKVDSDLQGAASSFAECILRMLVSICVVIVMTPFLLIVFLPLGYLYLQVQRTFRQSSRELRRLGSLAKSPIFQNLDESIAGATTIRAFRTETDFISKNEEFQTRAIATDFINSGIGRWMGMRLRFLGMAFVAAVALYVVLQEHVSFFGRFGLTLSASMVGLVLRYALEISGNMEGMIQNLTMTEQSLIPLERLTAFCDLAAEGALELPDDAAQQARPQTGEVAFKDVVMRYGDDMPTVLKGVSFVVPGGTSCGVVGRTGSGKSTLLVALFRLRTLDSGTIRVDGLDCATLGLHTLRRKLAIIPQDPIGFTGSLRFNLDPFGERSDTDIWAELEKVQLGEFTRSNGLDYHLSAGGENLSVGQRQLLCAARAFLQNSKILLLDEATAAVDFQTDNLIQNVLKTQVKKNSLTTITIAHRISTIIEFDNVLVMDQGKVGEFGPTGKLAGDPSSLFYTFVHPTKS